MYHLYILECKDKTLYCGITTNIEKRLQEHNGVNGSKLGAKYTKGRRPVKLVYSETFKNRSLALKAEYRVKWLTRKEKLQLIKFKKT